MSLPSGYKRLQYIQSSGTQYFNIGFNPNNNTRVVMDIDVLSTSGNTVPLFGARDASGSAVNSFVLWKISASSFRTDYATKTTNLSLTATGRHTIDKNKNVTTIDGTTVTQTSATFHASYPLCLFAVNGGGTIDSRKVHAKLYSCRVYDNSTLIRDLIPCSNASAEIGLWDDVNSVFYGNAGTGTFTAGPVIAIAADESEIKKLKYIQSTGTQYINTGFAPNQSTRVVCDTVFAAVSVGAWLFGARHEIADRTFGFLTYQNNYRSDFDTSSDGTITETQSGRFTIDKDGNITKINGSTVKTATAGTFQCSHSLFLFANNNNGTVSGYGKATVYSCQIYDNGTLVRDFIAAKLSDGTVGLYDKLNGLLYINVGTGTFISGGYALNLPVNIGGTWKEANEVFVNIGGTWKAVEAAFVNIGGTWKELG